MLQGKAVVTDPSEFAKAGNVCLTCVLPSLVIPSGHLVTCFLVLCNHIFQLGIKYFTILPNECIFISFDCIGSKRFAKFLSSIDAKHR